MSGLFSILAAQPAQAACREDETTIQVVARDVNGTLLSGINYVVHGQVRLVDGKVVYATRDLRGMMTPAG